MGMIILHIANANNSLAEKDIAIIKSGVKEAEDFISKHFDFDHRVDLIITSPSLLLNVSPDDGINAHTYSSNLIVLAVSTEVAPVRKDLIFELVCHEMSHSIRWAKNPEYVGCLVDDIIFEGLAVVFEERAMEETSKHERRPFLVEMQQTSQEVVDKITDYLGDKLYDPNYAYFPTDYPVIFYDGNKDLPKQAAYRLGYSLIKKHLSETGLSIFDAIVAPYSSFKKS